MKCIRCGTDVSKLEAAMNVAIMTWHIRSLKENDASPLCEKCTAALYLFINGYELLDESLFVSSLVEVDNDE